MTSASQGSLLRRTSADGYYAPAQSDTTLAVTSGVVRMTLTPAAALSDADAPASAGRRRHSAPPPARRRGLPTLESCPTPSRLMDTGSRLHHPAQQGRLRRRASPDARAPWRPKSAHVRCRRHVTPTVHVASMNAASKGETLHTPSRI